MKRADRAAASGRASNLGELQRIALQGQPPGDEAQGFLQRADPRSFEQAGLYIDGGSIFASSFLLLLMLVSGGNPE
ncbi:hypothetical protein HYH03_002226 [Edaphochlamys debaryana]|uniref:Uncharacterized protein n=1 Tax=Edaphochlamys debaryana TaxID=47281 RepID=A0A835YLL5_9CHLO|nr:hypothetical protein HYH03_002226 [Edaphochlamys debaryana]|eukprot:KAG2499939.1 hypothetical protein HYH03_002226 [Edaphochlamys debaryana]